MSLPDPGGQNIILVASNNIANVQSVVWFLREVAPRASNVQINIVGSVDEGVREHAPSEYKRYKRWFVGRVDDLASVYENARLVLLPTISGHGLSIKTVEAMASGLPLIATCHALRGITGDVTTLKGLTVADKAEDFACALQEAAAGAIPNQRDRLAAPVRAFYETHFSMSAYRRSLSRHSGWFPCQ